MRSHLESNYSITCGLPVLERGQGGPTGSEQILRTPSLSGSGEDDAFQRLLLELSGAAAKGVSSADILQLFCRSTRAYFGVSGAYVWHFTAPDQLVGAEADGWKAERFRNARLKTSDSPVAAEAIQRKKAVYANSLNTSRYPAASEFSARATMAAPVVVFNEVIGAVMFLHTSDSSFFDQDYASKATILAAQLGSFLEAQRLSAQALEEQRRAGILAEVAHSLHADADLAVLVEAVADRLRLLLRTPLLCILVRGAAGFDLWAVATENPSLGISVRARHDRKSLSFISDLAARALAAGEPISASVNPATHSLGDLAPAGTLMAAPFRTSSKEGAILVYPRREPFTTEEKSLLPVVTSFAAVAISNAELYATARGQAYELHQIVSISAELGGISDLDQFMRKFIQRATDFLGFRRSFLGLLEDGKVAVRWSYLEGKHGDAGYLIPEGILTQAMMRGELLAADDVTSLDGANQRVLGEFKVRQLLAVPLQGTNGRSLGMFGVLDRNDAGQITSEDIRRAQALAAQVSVALEVSKNLLLSEEHRRRSTALTSLALEVNSLLRGPEFAHRFVERAASIMDAQDAALIVQGSENGSSVVMRDRATGGEAAAEIQDKLAEATLSAFSSDQEAITVIGAARLLGAELATKAGWNEVILARLNGSEGDLLGVLCLADRTKPLREEDRQLLQAVAGQAAVSLENSRFITRIEQANRHWIEIFDSITDFIVAHDESGHVLRVNRSLADFIGVQPQQLIGLNMGALLATGSHPPVRTCPFCRSTGNLTDEYVHPALERTFLVSTSQVHAASSEGLQTIHVLKDITDRREAERRYRELFDNIQEGLFFCSPDGRFVEVNDALVRILGRNSREELLHSDPRELVFHDAEAHRAIFRELERQGALHNREEILKRKDGSPVHVLINAFAVRDTHGNVSQYRGLMLDVSGLKAFEAELQRERDFSGKILSNTQSLILVADTAGLVSYANRRWQVMGYEQEAILGRPLESLVGESRRGVLHEAYSTVLSGNHVDNLDLQVLRADGRAGQFSVNLSPMRDEQGHVSSIVVVMSDVTDAASLQSKLMHAEKMAAVGQLVSGVAHEVNNPLTAILGFADLLMENSELPESARKDLRVILQEAQRTKQIVQNLLSFARQMPPQRKPVQLNPILKRTIQLRSYDLQSRGVSVTERLKDHLPFVVGDAHQLQQVFLNILNNAYDAVREAGQGARIEISTSCTDNYVEVSFRDNGPGISHPDRIFDPFFTTKQVGEGTGLGLSICYGIVKEHGGEILCSNNTDDKGATFVVRLPIVTEFASLSAVAGVAKP
jgi:PAS domain S-box-containing protein